MIASEALGVTAYVGLGANLGDRRAALQAALRGLAAHPQVRLARVSSLYETAPVGVTDQPEFLNAVAAVETTLAPRPFLDVLLHLENSLGRVRTVRWGPRVIDLDLLLYGAQTVSLPGLDVPHPRLRERAFVLAPLAEVAPDLALPGDGKKVAELAEILSGGGNIRRIGFV